MRNEQIFFSALGAPFPVTASHRWSFSLVQFSQEYQLALRSAKYI